MPWFEAGKHGAEERDEPAPKLPALSLVTAADTCSGCGTRFQKDEPLAPGFLPMHVWERLGLSDKRGADDVEDEFTVEDEVEFLLNEERRARGLARTRGARGCPTRPPPRRAPAAKADVCTS